MHGESRGKNGRIEQDNFDAFPMLVIGEKPEVELILMPLREFWGGAGEPTPVIAAVTVLNAFPVATGKRIRQVLIKNNMLQMIRDK